MRRPLRDSISSKSLIIMGVPKRFHPMTVNSYKTNNNPKMEQVYKFVKDYIEDLYSNIDNCKGILFYGANGTGKTMLSCIILKEAYRRRYTCRRITFYDYINKKASSWGKEENWEDEINLFKSAELLVLEEVGKEMESKIAVPILEDLLRYREDNMLTTIICTNLSPQDIKEQYGNSIYSLLKGNTIPVEMDFEDSRLGEFKKRGKNYED